MSSKITWEKGLKIDLNEGKILGKVTNDRWGLFVANEWKRLIDPYTPRATGQLMGFSSMVELLPFKIHYTVDYAEDVYYNRRNVEFVRKGAGRNLFASQEWDKAAEKAGQKDKLYRTLNNALQSGRF